MSRLSASGNFAALMRRYSGLLLTVEQFQRRQSCCRQLLEFKLSTASLPRQFVVLAQVALPAATLSNAPRAEVAASVMDPPPCASSAKSTRNGGLFEPVMPAGADTSSESKRRCRRIDSASALSA